MNQPYRNVTVVIALAMVLIAAIVGARLVGQHSTDESAAAEAEKERAAGVGNRLVVANMLNLPIRLAISDVDPSQWGRTPPDDEPPAGLQAEVIAPNRVSGETTLRPLRIEDGGGDATFTLGLVIDGETQARPLIGVVPVRSTTIEYCTTECFDGYGYFDWQDAPEPQLDVFRKCNEEDRVIGSYLDSLGVVRDVHAVFQCDSVRFQSVLILHE
jgi:hypothetical protein